MGQPWKESFLRLPIILFLCDGKITNKYGISYSQNSPKYWGEVSPKCLTEQLHFYLLYFHIF